MSGRRHAALLPIVCLLAAAGLTSSAFAQLSDEDIANLRERAKLEGWTFEIGRNWATEQPLETLCGTVVPEGVEEPANDGPPVGGPRGDLPAAYDWRDYGGCTPIRNQGGCGSCWAFSAVGAVESSILINDGISTDLSEQWLVSCTTSGSCSGGWPSAAFGFMVINDRWTDSCDGSGAVPESEFPYVAWDKPCACPYSHPYWIEGTKGVAGGMSAIDNIKQAILDYGPISVTVAVDSAFQGYDGGVFNACWDGSINHAVVLVGWDDNQGSDGVWIMRNSWGTWWGDEGYMLIEYGCSKIGSNATVVVYRPDCNENGVRDDWDFDSCDGSPWCSDCNGNGILDECDILSGDNFDYNGNGVPDACEFAGVDHVCVDAGASGANTGIGWADALTDFNAAFSIAESQPGVNEIWVHAGTYAPAAPGGDRNASFILHDELAVRGSFAGTETSPDQRDFGNPANRTVLTGDLNGDDLPGFVNTADNSYHVVTSVEVDSTAVLDGFTIVGGNADGDEDAGKGGGLFNCDGSATIINCAFLGNYAAHFGGAVYNEARWYISSTEPSLTNCVFCGNQAGEYGGAFFSLGTEFNDANPVFTNCTIAANTAPNTGGLYTVGMGLTTLANSILYDNADDGGDAEAAQFYADYADVNFSCIEGFTGAYGGAGNISGDPLLANPGGADGLLGTLDDDLKLSACSPCTDAGDNSAVPAGVDTDLAGAPRMIDDLVMPDTGNGSAPIVDMGAYEYTGEHPGDLDGDGDIDLSDLGVLLGNYGQSSGMTAADGDLDGDGDVDLSDLGILLGLYGTGCQ